MLQSVHLMVSAVVLIGTCGVILGVSDLGGRWSSTHLPMWFLLFMAFTRFLSILMAAWRCPFTEVGIWAFGPSLVCVPVDSLSWCVLLAKCDILADHVPILLFSDVSLLFLA